MKDSPYCPQCFGRGWVWYYDELTQGMKQRGCARCKVRAREKPKEKTVERGQAEVNDRR